MESKIFGIPFIVWLFIIFVVGGIFGLTYLFEYLPLTQRMASVQKSVDVQPKVLFVTPMPVATATPSATPGYKYYTPTSVPTVPLK